jgi:hypothetical protein
MKERASVPPGRPDRLPRLYPNCSSLIPPLPDFLPACPDSVLDFGLRTLSTRRRSSIDSLWSWDPVPLLLLAVCGVEGGSTADVVDSVEDEGMYDQNLPSEIQVDRHTAMMDRIRIWLQTRSYPALRSKRGSVWEVNQGKREEVVGPPNLDMSCASCSTKRKGSG